MVKLRLTIELVPSSSWFNNVRAITTASQWNLIKSKVSSQSYNICEICGGIGPKHPVECHEIWSFDDKNSIQKLDGMIALCPDCHMVKHIGLAEIMGKKQKALKHFMKINKVSFKIAEKCIEDAFKLWTKRSKNNWTLDLSILKDYGIDLSKIKEKA